MKPCGEQLIWQCSVLMKPSLTTISHGGAVPILVPPERRRNVWYACEPLSGTSQPTIGNPPSSPPAPIITVFAGPMGLGGSATTGAAIGIGIGAGFELNTLTPIRTRMIPPSVIRMTVSQGKPALDWFHGGASVSCTGSVSSLSTLRIRLCGLPSQFNPSPALVSYPGKVRYWRSAMRARIALIAVAMLSAEFTNWVCGIIVLITLPSPDSAPL